MKRSLFNLIAALLLCFVASSVSAQFSGSGSGTADDPYRIYNAVQLNQVRNFSGNQYFSLEADIDMTDWIAENNPVQGWQPIGNSNNSFNGYFDGNGHTISHLWINRSDTDYIGLFGYVRNGHISNLHIINSAIEGKYYVGGVIGYYEHTGNSETWRERTISNCSFNGIIKGEQYVGGLIAYISSEATNVHLKISDCLSDCNMNTSISNAGGMVGYIDNDYYGFILPCFP